MKPHLRAPLLALLTAASVLAFAAPAGAQAKPIQCAGGPQACQAVVSLAGGASNKTVRIALPARNLKLVSVTAKPHWIHGAYSLTKGSYSRRGALYTATLNAVQSIPKSGRLTLQFQAPGLGLPCNSVTKDIAYLTISRIGSGTAAGTITCQQANAVAQTWTRRFLVGQQVESFSVNDVRYTCKVVPIVPQNFRCDGAGTRVRFAGPTGR